MRGCGDSPARGRPHARLQALREVPWRDLGRELPRGQPGGGAFEFRAC